MHFLAADPSKRADVVDAGAAFIGMDHMQLYRNHQAEVDQYLQQTLKVDPRSVDWEKLLHSVLLHAVMKEEHPFPGLLMWQWFFSECYEWYQEQVDSIRPHVIIHDVLLNGEGKYMALLRDIPSIGSMPVMPTGDTSQWGLPAGEARSAVVLQLKLQLLADARKAAERGHTLSLEELSAVIDGLTPGGVSWSPRNIIYEGFDGARRLRSLGLGGGVLACGRDFRDQEIAAQTGHGYSSEDRRLMTQIDDKKWIKSGRKCIFVSLGTISNQPGYFSEFLFEALSEMEDELVGVVYTYGYQPDVLPENVIAYSDRKSLDVVFGIYSRADIFMTHMGANSYHEALWNGLPVICHPLGGDQHWNTWEAVTVHKVGVRFPEDAMLVNENLIWLSEVVALSKKNAFKSAFKRVARELTESLEGFRQTCNAKRNLVRGEGPDRIAARILDIAGSKQHTGPVQGSTHAVQLAGVDASGGPQS